MSVFILALVACAPEEPAASIALAPEEAPEVLEAPVASAACEEVAVIEPTAYPDLLRDMPETPAEVPRFVPGGVQDGVIATSACVEPCRLLRRLPPRGYECWCDGATLGD